MAELSRRGILLEQDLLAGSAKLIAERILEPLRLTPRVPEAETWGQKEALIAQISRNPSLGKPAYRT